MNEIIAESDTFEIVEGNIYFPPESIKKEYFHESEKTTFCGWKGNASYFSIQVDGKENQNAAWCYNEPYTKAEHIKDYVAFWNGVQVEK